MNLIDESFEPKKDNSKKTMKIVIALMVIVIIAIIGVFGALAYIEGTTLKLYLNGAQNQKMLDMMVTEEDGTIYFPIKEVATFFGYESYNGEYTDKSEDQSKCYVQCEDEVANFALNSNKVYKLTLADNDDNYDYYYTKKPVKAINGKLYATTDAIEKGFNISFNYDENTKRIQIYTMPFLIESYANKVLDYGYEAISEDFTNKKTVLNNMLVVTKNQNKVYAVIDVKGNDIIESKYDDIKYLPNSGDFLVTSNNKVGIISAKRETKIQILYDSLELIDSDLGLYLAKRDNKYGVIDSKGSIKIYIEYDEIGIDKTRFAQNDIKNKYLLDNGMIPARKDKFWGAFDKNGNQIINFEYDSFGYIASSNKDAINLLLIPDYNVMVACKDKKYTLINSSGKMLCMLVLDDVYMTISSGVKYYKMNYNDNIGANVIDFLDSQGVRVNSKSNNNNNNNNSNNTNNTTEQNTIGNTNDNSIFQNNINEIDNTMVEDGV